MKIRLHSWGVVAVAICLMAGCNLFVFLPSESTGYLHDTRFSFEGFSANSKAPGNAGHNEPMLLGIEGGRPVVVWLYTTSGSNIASDVTVLLRPGEAKRFGTTVLSGWAPSSTALKFVRTEGGANGLDFGVLSWGINLRKLTAGSAVLTDGGNASAAPLFPSFTNASLYYQESSVLYYLAQSNEFRSCRISTAGPTVVDDAPVFASPFAADQAKQALGLGTSTALTASAVCYSEKAKAMAVVLKSDSSSDESWLVVWDGTTYQGKSVSFASTDTLCSVGARFFILNSTEIAVYDTWANRRELITASLGSSESSSIRYLGSTAVNGVEKAFFANVLIGRGILVYSVPTGAFE